MLGPILVFLGVCALVATFMAIAHSFLRASEQDEQIQAENARAAARQEEARAEEASPGSSRAPRWAH